MIGLRALWIAFLFSAIFSLGIYFQSRQERGFIPKNRRPLYLPRWGIFVILYLPAVFLFVAYSRDAEKAVSLYTGETLMLTGGLGLLLLLLPALRKILFAESCAYLWMSLCFLFILSGRSPQWSIPLPFSPPSQQLMSILFWIWLTGFAAVMLWSILTHLYFRRRLLKNAKPVEDESYQQMWLHQLKIANLPTEMIRLKISPDTQTPLSIGLLWRTTCLVLPERAYSSDELAMILQHELIHISRRDSVLKFTMSFWAAFMWFNPLAWIALRVCAQDLELSCDEAVLYGRPERSRMEYAKLLLQSAPSQLGFTSCLSASATSLRYRLKNVVTCRKRIVGSIIIGFLCFLMLLVSLCTGVRYRAMSANELLFVESDVSRLEVIEVFATMDGVDVYGECEKDPLLLDYIETLSLQRTTQAPDVYSASNVVQLTLRSPERNYMLTFGDRYLRVVTVTHSGDPARQKTSFYQLDSNPDWQFLRSCITPR